MSQFDTRKPSTQLTVRTQHARSRHVTNQTNREIRMAAKALSSCTRHRSREQKRATIQQFKTTWWAPVWDPRFFQNHCFPHRHIYSAGTNARLRYEFMMWWVFFGSSSCRQHIGRLDIGLFRFANPLNMCNCNSLLCNSNNDSIAYVYIYLYIYHADQLTC